MEPAAKSAKLKGLFENGRLRSYSKNELILRADETPQGVYMIETGMIKIFSLTKHNDEHVHHFFGPGDFFPVVWTFRNVLRQMNYEALAPTTIWVIPRETFMDYISHNSEVMLEVMAEIVDRYRLYSGRIDNLLYSDARERSAYRLLSLANRFGVETEQGLVIQATLTHEDLAHSINMTRETFGRSFGRLQDRGIIGYDEQRRLIIKNLPALVNIIGREETQDMWPKLTRYLD